jgi:hypothetical protein
LASSRAVAPRNDLDGGQLWYVNSMLPDPEHHCVWVSVDTGMSNRSQYAPSKYGLWKFSPADGSLRKADPGTHGYLTWSDSRIFFLAHGFHSFGQWRGAYGLFDPRTEDIVKLSEKLQAPDDLTDRSCRALINGNVIAASQRIYTTSGEYQLQSMIPRWNYVVRFGPGVLACNLAEGKMWYIDARPPGDKAEPEAEKK